MSSIGDVLDDTRERPTMAAIPQPVRQADPAILSKLYAAFMAQKAICVAYTSINSGPDSGQWLVPTHFSSDGENVHLRAFSYKHRSYRDYLPVRVSPTSSFQVRDLDEPLPHDVDWHTMSTFWLRPKSNLTEEQAAVVRDEHGFENELLGVEIRKAMEIYFRRRWRLDDANSRLEIAKTDHRPIDPDTNR